jgi:hypothetical protein
MSRRPTTDPTINATFSRMSRIKVVDQALQQRYVQQQDTAMEAQYARAETDAIGPERKAWRAIRRSAAKRRLSAT